MTFTLEWGDYKLRSAQHLNYVDICITNICIMYRARDTLVNNISVDIMLIVMDINACCAGH